MTGEGNACLEAKAKPGKRGVLIPRIGQTTKGRAAGQSHHNLYEKRAISHLKRVILLFMPGGEVLVAIYEGRQNHRFN